MLITSNLYHVTVIDQALIKPGFNKVSDKIANNTHFQALVMQGYFSIIEGPKEGEEEAKKEQESSKKKELSKEDLEKINEVLGSYASDARAIVSKMDDAELLAAIMDADDRRTVKVSVKERLDKIAKGYSKHTRKSISGEGSELT